MGILVPFDMTSLRLSGNCVCPDIVSETHFNSYGAISGADLAVDVILTDEWLQERELPRSLAPGQFWVRPDLELLLIFDGLEQLVVNLCIERGPFGW